MVIGNIVWQRAPGALILNFEHSNHFQERPFKIQNRGASELGCLRKILTSRHTERAQTH